MISHVGDDTQEQSEQMCPALNSGQSLTNIVPTNGFPKAIRQHLCLFIVLSELNLFTFNPATGSHRRERKQDQLSAPKYKGLFTAETNNPI